MQANIQIFIAAQKRRYRKWQVLNWFRDNNIDMLIGIISIKNWRRKSCEIANRKMTCIGKSLPLTVVAGKGGHQMSQKFLKLQEILLHFEQSVMRLRKRMHLFSSIFLSEATYFPLLS